MNPKDFRVLVTGANGFIGKNLTVRFNELQGFSILPFVRENDRKTLSLMLTQADAVVHLAGENRPDDVGAFTDVNVGLTVALCDAIRAEYKYSGRKISLFVASSIQAKSDNHYGRSKLAAEQVVEQLSSDIGNSVTITRLPGVFGKWCKPNYNSVVATFCHNVARDRPIHVSDSAMCLRLVYVDDVVSFIIAAVKSPPVGFSFITVAPEYNVTLGCLVEQIRAFKANRESLLTQSVGDGFLRALYATYMSYQPVESFCYPIPQHRDERGVFVEILKTLSCGQFSFFTAHPGVTRGGHYHHTKTEKFMVVKGKALFRFKHIITDELIEFTVSASESIAVDTIPGWAHDITNISDEEMLVILWANEIFDQSRPDTVTFKMV